MLTLFISQIYRVMFIVAGRLCFVWRLAILDQHSQHSQSYCSSSWNCYHQLCCYSYCSINVLLLIIFFIPFMFCSMLLLVYGHHFHCWELYKGLVHSIVINDLHCIVAIPLLLIFVRVFVQVLLQLIMNDICPMHEFYIAIIVLLLIHYLFHHSFLSTLRYCLYCY